ncbi:hypothetical protein FLM9_1033, partial [Candidatus Synechococcus spongiarum]
MHTHALKLLMGAALLTTLAACQGRMPERSSEPATSHESDGDNHMMSGEEAQDHMDGPMAMGDPIFSGTFQKGEADAAGTFAIHKDGDTAMIHLSEDFAT